jgi:hypothetical protein
MGPIAWAVYKYSVKAVFQYALGIPHKLLGLILLTFRQKATVVLAVITSFRDTLAKLAEAVATGKGWMEIPGLFVEDLLKKSLAASDLLAQGLGKWLQYLNADGICTKLVEMDLLLSGLLDVWTGIASIIVLMFLYRLYRGRWQKAEVDRHDQLIFLALIFAVTALIQIGIEQTRLYTVFERGTSLLDVLAQLMPEAGVEEPVNQTAGNTTTG